MFLEVQLTKLTDQSKLLKREKEFNAVLVDFGFFLLTVWCNNICNAKAAQPGHNNEAALIEAAHCSALSLSLVDWAESMAG